MDPNDRYINDAKIAEALAQMLNRVGIDASVETMPKAVYFKRASRGGPNKSPEFSFMLLGWGAGSGEASSPLKALLHTYDKSKGLGAANRGRHSDAKVDANLSNRPWQLLILMHAENFLLRPQKKLLEKITA